MTAIQFIVALLFGLCIAPAAAFLIFVYPYSDISLKPVWWGLGVGGVVGIATVLTLAGLLGRAFK